MLFSIRLLISLSILCLCTSQSHAGQTLADTLDSVKRSVVAVGTFMPSRSPRGIFLGSGFAITRGELIITNAHVLPASLDTKHREIIAVFIRVDDKIKVIPAFKIAVDETHDVAVLKLSKGLLPGLNLGDNDKVREGKLYAFTGYPIGMVLGLYPVTHRGIISAISPIAIPMLKAKQLDANLLRKLQSPYEVFQLDATAYPGNSGSPLYDIETGDVVGIINKVFVQDSKEKILSTPSGITYAIPIRHVKDILKKNGLR